MWLRSAVSAACAVFGVLEVPAERRPLALAVAAVVLAWSVFRLVALGRRTPGWAGGVIAMDAVVLVAIGAAQALAGPGYAGGWTLALISITAVTSSYEWPSRPRVGIALAMLGLGSYVAGFAAQSGVWAPAVLPGVRVLVEIILSRLSYLLVRSQARVADRLSARIAARRRQAAVAAARRAAEREYLVTLHDTASTTLLMVAEGYGEAEVAERARHDLEAIAGVPEAGAGPVDLAALLTTAARHDDVLVRGRPDAMPPLPARPALAIFHGVREALTNVARHAGVAEASLRAGLDEHGTVIVEVRDRGRGFVPDDVGPHRRGISGSIVGRMADAGGRATVISRVGEGTTLRWMWPVEGDG
ncbi:sensor histidine kinase [Nonomuraea sp. NPDC059007]|uniref:sensor histidine kinase n=1 Tax=Nonomuraea sp. NPDC059007 TaxID=3346692 RepID=UPI003674DDC3